MDFPQGGLLGNKPNEPEPEPEPVAETETDAAEPEPEVSAGPEFTAQGKLVLPRPLAELSCPTSDWKYVMMSDAEGNGRCLLGRVSKTNNADDPDVQLENDKAVSRQHCVVNYDHASDEFSLEVLAKKGVSINGGGTFAPGDLPPALSGGDTMTIGKTVVSIFTKPRPVAPKKKKSAASKRKKYGRGGDSDKRYVCI